jgi:hypothetical protein
MFFYKNVIDTSSDDESGNDSDQLMAAATLTHEHNELQRPGHRGSTRPHKDNVKRNREDGRHRLYKGYIHDISQPFSA